MLEISRNHFPVPELSLDNLDILTQKQIFNPTIGKFYAEFLRNEINKALEEILNQIPTEHHPPILHTLTTHVTKEKPVFIYGIGVGNSVDPSVIRFVATSTDLLWCLSLMVDDIIDENDLRANKITAWKIYGQKETYSSADVTLRTFQDLTIEKLSPQTNQLLIETVDDGLKSLKDPAIKNMDSNIEDILDNIDRRARFHCEYPIRALLTDNRQEEMISIATDALFCVNSNAKSHPRRVIGILIFSIVSYRPKKPGSRLQSIYQQFLWNFFFLKSSDT